MTPAQTPEPRPVFEMGEIVVRGGAPDSAPSTATASLNREAIERMARRDLPEALSLLPEIAVGRSGTRNEALILVRGFDLRHVPLFVDGIPVYLPYEGTVDTGRLLTFPFAHISVSRGFSPVLYGPNTLGGAINIVTRRPTRDREALLRGGVFSGNGVEGAFRAGLADDDGYIQASVAAREQDYYRLSRDFEPAGAEDGGRRENSSRRDVQLDAKAVWTPSAGDEFALGWVRQDSRKDVPPYAGRDPTAQPRYWRYPIWEKNSLYFIGRKELGLGGQLKGRLYYDTYENTLESFDDDTYTTQTRPYAFTSYYDDYAFGGGADYGLQLGDVHSPRASAQYRRDAHREHLRGRPESEFSDDTFAVGLEDSLRLGSAWTLVLGASFERRENVEAINRSGPVPERFPDNVNESFNPQAGLFYTISGGVFRATVARKSRFPTLKDRYSYRRGLAIPNPDLDEERAVHYEVGYDGRLIPGLSGRLSLFYSRLSDAIQDVSNVRYDPATDTWLTQYQNVRKAEHRGLEAGLDWAPSDWLKAGVDYALLDRENTSHPELKPTDTPKHRLLAYAELQPSERLSVVPGVEYNSSRYSTSAGVKTDGFWIADVHLRLTLPRGWEAACGVRNVFDENYELTEGYPEEGRNFYAGATYRL